MKNYLPIGSVVLLKEGQKKIMIYGRIQQQKGTETVWDYIGCLYPEGNISEEFTYLFNHKDISEVVFEGYRDEEEDNFQKAIREAIEEGTLPE